MCAVLAEHTILPTPPTSWSPRSRGPTTAGTGRTRIRSDQAVYSGVYDPGQVVIFIAGLTIGAEKG
jgi:hypothetical protein